MKEEDFVARKEKLLRFLEGHMGEERFQEAEARMEQLEEEVPEEERAAKGQQLRDFFGGDIQHFIHTIEFLALGSKDWADYKGAVARLMEANPKWEEKDIAFGLILQVMLNLTSIFRLSSEECIRMASAGALMAEDFKEDCKKMGLDFES